MASLSEIRSFDRETIALRWRQFALWWSGEFRLAMPAAWRPLLDGRVLPCVFISCSRDSVVCELNADARTIQQSFPVAEFDGSALRAWLGQLGLRRDQVLVGPVIAEDLFLRRNLCIPREALASLQQILDQEVIHRTPFRLPDIWHAARPIANETDGGTVSLCHWIITRDRAMAAIAPMPVALEEFDFLAVRTGAGYTNPVVSLRSNADTAAPWASRAIKSLVAALLATVLLGSVAFEWCQANVANNLEAELLEAKASVQGGKSRFSQLTRLYALKADGGFLAVWDELSRILPDDTFLTELRMNQGPITISGYSSQAAHLVRIVDQSPMFSGATLVSAILPDATEGKDRFSIKFRLRNGPMARPDELARKATK